MKKIILILFVISLNAFSVTIKKASVEDLKMLVKAASMKNSAYWATYIGESKSKIYIEFETMADLNISSLTRPKQETTLYWVPVSESKNEKIIKIKEYSKKFKSRKHTCNSINLKKKTKPLSKVLSKQEFEAIDIFDRPSSKPEWSGFVMDIGGDDRKEVFSLWLSASGTGGNYWNIFSYQGNKLKHIADFFIKNNEVCIYPGLNKWQIIKDKKTKAIYFSGPNLKK